MIMGEMADYEMQNGFDAFLDGYGGEDGEYDEYSGVYMARCSRPRKPHGPGKCPCCGGETVKRVNRYTGTAFYGCKRFPECSGTRNG